jgi:hypothetical protein
MKKKLKKALTRNDGFGLNEILGIAAAVIIAALIIIPGLNTFAGDVISKMNGWWTTMADKVFLTTP